jgi:predicted nucleic acid-binding protein
MNIYCDTSTLFHNVKRHETEPKTGRELLALQKLLTYRRSGHIKIFRSRVNLREIVKTKDTKQLANLIADYETLLQIPLDEKFYGTEKIITDPYGGYVENPLVSDVQDEDLCAELIDGGLEIYDAQHITQAVRNSCDVFLTRDEETIITPHRKWIEARFAGFRVRLPSELLVDLSSP